MLCKKICKQLGKFLPKEGLYIFSRFYLKSPTIHTRNRRRKCETRKQEIADDRFASLEIQLLSIQQQGSQDNAQRVVSRAMPPRESWLGERDENNSGRGEYYGTLQ